MTNRRVLQTACDSGSLWNFTCSPGWNEEDVRVLRLAIMRYGCGNWKDICRHFPNKTNGQLNLQTQRLFGQQSLAEFFKLHIDPDKIRVINKSKTGPNILRKNDCIVNTGDKLTKKLREERIKLNEKEYGIPENEYLAIEVPIRFDEEPELTNVHDKVRRLSEVHRTLFVLQKRLAKLNRLKKDPVWIEQYNKSKEKKEKIVEYAKENQLHLKLRVNPSFVCYSAEIETDTTTTTTTATAANAATTDGDIVMDTVVENLVNDDSKDNDIEMMDKTETKPDKPVEQHKEKEVVVEQKDQEEENKDTDMTSTNATTSNEDNSNNNNNENDNDNENKKQETPQKKKRRKSTKGKSKRTKKSGKKSSRKRKRRDWDDDEEYVPNSKRQRTKK